MLTHYLIKEKWRYTVSFFMANTHIEFIPVVKSSGDLLMITPRFPYRKAQDIKYMYSGPSLKGHSRQRTPL